MFRIMIHID
uniref:Uncharacterized protein n=1 Tax=Nymphaea colorata TaxID=210225 RepID=A0A5K0Y8X8_9MAGN|nr:unnamed protein product [Nymphaea colorata]